MKLRVLALGTALLAATVVSISSSVEAAPWGWRGRGWHGGLGPRWNEGGWGLGGVGYGLAAGVIIGNAIVTPYGYFNGGYYVAHYGYRRSSRFQCEATAADKCVPVACLPLLATVTPD